MFSYSASGFCRAPSHLRHSISIPNSLSGGCVSQYADEKFQKRVASFVGEYFMPSVVWDSLLLTSSRSRSQHAAGGIISTWLPDTLRDRYNLVLLSSHFPILPSPPSFPSGVPNHLHWEISSGRIAVHCAFPRASSIPNADLLTTVAIARFPASSFRTNSNLAMPSSNGLNLRLNGCNKPSKASTCIAHQLTPHNVPS